MSGFATRLLFVWLLSVVTITLAPFDFRDSEAAPRIELIGEDDAGQQSAIHLTLNVLLFAPLGVLVHLGKLRPGRKLSTPIIVAAVGACVISLAVELLQRFLPGRDSSVVDVLANVAGAVMGVLTSWAWGDVLFARLDLLRSSTSPATLACLVAVLLIIGFAISARLQAQSRLTNWSPEFPLLVGNEATGDRPWRGRVFSIEITDRATRLHQYAGRESRRLEGSVVGHYDFSGASPYVDTAGTSPPLDSVGAPAEPADDGAMRTTQRAWLQTPGPASALIGRLRTTNAFTVRLTCASDDPKQKGPARIMSNSVSPSLRNLTLGQDGSDLVVRLRTPITGINGSPPETRIPNVFSKRELRHIVVTYDGASLITTVAPVQGFGRTDFTPGFIAALLLTPETTHLPPAKLCDVAYLVVLLLPPGVLIALLARAPRHGVAIATGFVCAAALGLEGTLTVTSGRSFDWHNAFVTAATAATVLTVAGGALWTPRSATAHA